MPDTNENPENEPRITLEGQKAAGSGKSVWSALLSFLQLLILPEKTILDLRKRKNSDRNSAWTGLGSFPLLPAVENQKIWGLGKKGIWIAGCSFLFLVGSLVTNQSEGPSFVSGMATLLLFLGSGYFMLLLARLYEKNTVLWGCFGLFLPVFAQMTFPFFMNKSDGVESFSENGHTVTSTKSKKKSKKNEVKEIRKRASQQGKTFMACKYRSGLPYFKNNSDVDIMPGKEGLYFLPAWGNKHYYHVPWNRFVRCDSTVSMDSGDQAVLTGAVAAQGGKGGVIGGFGTVVGGAVAADMLKKHELKIFYKKGDEANAPVLEVLFETSKNEKIKNTIMKYAAEA